MSAGAGGSSVPLVTYWSPVNPDPPPPPESTPSTTRSASSATGTPACGTGGWVLPLTSGWPVTWPKKMVGGRSPKFCPSTSSVAEASRVTWRLVADEGDAAHGTSRYWKLPAAYGLG